MGKKGQKFDVKWKVGEILLTDKKSGKNRQSKNKGYVKV